MKYFFDTEFMEDGTVIEMLSIGVVCEDGREYYAVSDADRSHANDWVVDNVLPHLGEDEHKSRYQIGADLYDFVAAGRRPPEWWAYFADYDWVVLCQLYGRMIDLPKGWPMFAMDLKQYAISLGNPKLPVQTGTKHNALEDARWVRDTWEWLEHSSLEAMKVLGNDLRKEQAEKERLRSAIIDCADGLEKLSTRIDTVQLDVHVIPGVVRRLDAVVGLLRKNILTP